MNNENPKIIKKEDIDDQLSLDDRLQIEDGHSSQPSLSSKVVNDEEVAALETAKGVIAEAEKQAEEIRSKARSLLLQVEQKIQASREKGFLQGREEGYAKMTEELTRIQRDNQEVLNQIEREGVSLVYEIAQKIIGESIQTSADALVGMIRQALLSSMGKELTVYVNPVDLERIKDQESKLISVLQAVQTLHIKASENIKPGGCIVDSELGSIDASLDLQMEAIKRALEISP
ncbi:MAG: hypothetical protein HQM16_06080 [Deltaproteobacteria bacterium]|nr:hypothetical protein [Deltaproteobacteria bacterium]